MFLGLFCPNTSSSLEAEASSNKEEQLLRASVAVIELSNQVDFKLVRTNLTSAAIRSDISAILLVVDSPGGSISRFSALHDLIKRITRIKPVVGIVIGSAVSCGYLVASATNHIFVQRASCIGGIGVIFEIERWKNINRAGSDNNKINTDISVEVFSAGEFKNMLLTTAPPLTSRQREYLRQTVDDDYKLFLKMVAENRNLHLEDYKLWAEGKMFNGEDAVALGLVDEIGTIFEASDKLLEMINSDNPSTTFKAINFVNYD